MKRVKKNQEYLKDISNQKLLSLVGKKLEGRVLFPEKLESARRTIDSIKSWPEHLRIPQINK